MIETDKSRRHRRNRRQQPKCKHEDQKRMDKKSVSTRRIRVASTPPIVPKYLPPKRRIFLNDRPSNNSKSLAIASREKQNVRLRVNQEPSPTRNGPMSMGELYERYKRMGTLEVFFAMYG